ncbi:uncharacterized protein LOC113383286 [Ctenocephalides felis]|uniref:uncharacterized protein LOC113383286 n=1 Tax=Ctenocephalides felis TaxID=7515 RepID=UPI000E6E541F|nr:uncharacterized protein LOC113383286 [Ctenocephalides felis]
MLSIYEIVSNLHIILPTSAIKFYTTESTAPFDPTDSSQSNSKLRSSTYQAIQLSTSESTALITFNSSNSNKLSSIYQAIQLPTSESTTLIAYNLSNSKKLSSIYQAVCILYQTF